MKFENATYQNILLGIVNPSPCTVKLTNVLIWGRATRYLRFNTDSILVSKLQNYEHSCPIDTDKI